jgi:hypothetical protein
MAAETSKISGEEMYQWAGEICGFGPRRPGSPGFERARDYIANKIENWGANTWIDEIEIPMFFPRNLELSVLSPEKAEIDAWPLYWAGSTPPEGIEAELVDVGYGTSRDFKSSDVKGKIVLINLGRRVIAKAFVSLKTFLVDSYGNAIKNGAAGVVTFFENTPENAYQHSSIAKDMEISGEQYPIPGLAIGKEDGFWLARLCAGGAVRVRLLLRAETGTAKTYTIMALLPGKTEEVILVEGHWCSTFTGAIDNAGGNAAWLGIIKHFSRVPEKERGKTMLFQAGSTHEYALCNLASYNVIRRYPEYVSKTAFVLGMDHVASSAWREGNGNIIDDPGQDNKRYLAMSENLVLYPLVKRAYRKYGLKPVLRVPGLGLCESGVYQNLGIPQIRLVGVPLGYHTPWDTMDHFTPDQIERYTRAHVEILEKIHEVPGKRLAAANLWRLPTLFICGGISPNPYEPGHGENLLRKLMNTRLGGVMRGRYSLVP